MSKDPAFLFYSADFIMGTMTMTNEQVGKYIRLLCFQHQSGHISEQDMLCICSAYDERIFSKFQKDEEGLYFNSRLDSESEKRQNYSKSRRNNAKPKSDTKDNSKHMPSICKAHAEHMEDVNRDVNIDIDIDKKDGGVGEERKDRIKIDNWQIIIDDFNLICPTMTILKLSEERKTNIKARLVEFPDKSLNEIFQRVADSDFLTGRDGKWKGCSFDWIFKKANYLKIAEGNYDNKTTKGQSWEIEAFTKAAYEIKDI